MALAWEVIFSQVSKHLISRQTQVGNLVPWIWCRLQW